MKEKNNKIIKQLFKQYLLEVEERTLVIKLIAAIILLIFLFFSEWKLGYFYIFYLPISIVIFLFIFHVLTRRRYLSIKIKLWNFFLFSLLVMIYSLNFIHLQKDNLSTSVVATILVVFLISLELKSDTFTAIIVYFVPTLFFVVILLSFFKLSKVEFIIISKLIPMIILGFILNRLQYYLRLSSFKTNYWFEKERETSRQLYEEILSINTTLKQKNEEIITQRDEIEIKKQIIEDAHREIKSSIRYAKEIQRAMLPTKRIFESYFREHFIFYKPKDIISGDFYWGEKIGQRIICVVADCSGHGVPGAMLSMLGISLLNRVITYNYGIAPADILLKLREEIKRALKDTTDTIDMALWTIDRKTMELEFAGAYLSLYIYRGNELIELKGDRQPVGSYLIEHKFKNYRFLLQYDDILYAFTDGFIDQFNEENKKYKKHKFKRLLKSIGVKPLMEQYNILVEEFYNWQGTQEQVDDVLVIGLRI